MRAFSAVLCSVYGLASPAVAAPLIAPPAVQAMQTIHAQAVDRSFKLVNKTGKTLNSVIAKQSATTGAPDIPLIASALAANASSNVAINVAGNNCMFDLTISALNTAPKVINSVDVCQTDAITLE
jgi:hypothetical protein